jgi:hypothetical protein
MSNASQRIIPLEEGWNDEIKAKASHILNVGRKSFLSLRFSVRRLRTFLVLSVRFELSQKNVGSNIGSNKKKTNIFD